MSRRTGVLIIRWVVVPALILAGGLLVASNVILQSRSARGWFERKIEKRSGLDWTIDSLSWTPWTGIQVGGVRAELVTESGERIAPIYAVEEIDLAIDWTELWKGKLTPREVRMRRVRAALPVELMGLLPSPEAEFVEAVASGDDAAAPAPGSEPDEPGPPGPPGPEAAGGATDQEEPERVPPLDGMDRAEPPALPRAAAPAADDRPAAGAPVNLSVEDGELRVYSLTGGGQADLLVRGLKAEIPMGGEDREGWLHVEAVTLGGEPVTGPIRATMQWRRPFLVLPAKTFEWAGMEVQAAASLRTRGAALCHAEVRLIPGALEPIPVPFWPDLTVGAAGAQMRSRFRGDLADVRSWRGDSVVELTGIEFRPGHGRESVSFDLARLTTVLHGRAVQVVDARLLSERLSLLGNGLVLSDGRVYGIVRIVADREYAEAVTKVAVGSFVAGGWTRSWLAPLLTPDRYYRDINVRGTVRGATVDVEKNEGLMDAGQAWERMVTYLRRELGERSEGAPPSPPREKIWFPESP